MVRLADRDFHRFGDHGSSAAADRTGRDQSRDRPADDRRYRRRGRGWQSLRHRPSPPRGSSRSWPSRFRRLDVRRLAPSRNRQYRPFCGIVIRRLEPRLRHRQRSRPFRQMVTTTVIGRMFNRIVLPVFEHGVVAGRDRHGAWIYDPYSEQYFRHSTKVIAGGGGSGETIAQMERRRVLQKAVPERCKSATTQDTALVLKRGRFRRVGDAQKQQSKTAGKIERCIHLL